MTQLRKAQLDISIPLDFVNDFDADPTGSTAIDSAWSAAMTYCTTNKTKLHIPGGTYVASTPLQGADNVEVFGDGIGVTVIRPTLTGWGASLDDKALLELRGTTNFYIHDLTLDQNSQTRTSSNYVSYTMGLAAASYNKIERVTFLNGGLDPALSGGTLSGNPDVYLCAKDFGTDLSSLFGGSFTGSCVGNIFKDVTIDRSGTSLFASFGIKASTHFDAVTPRAKEDYIYFCEHNVFENVRGTGMAAFCWLDFAGGGTRHNRVIGGDFTGTGAQAVAFDKGSYYNSCRGATAHDISKYLNLGDVEVFNIRLNPFISHGYSSLNGGGQSANNTFIDCHVRDCGSFSGAKGSTYDCGFSAGDFADGTIFDNCVVDNVVAGSVTDATRITAGFLLGTDSSGTKITNCSAINVGAVVATNAGGGSSDLSDVQIRNVSGVGIAQGALLSCGAGFSLNGLIFESNHIECLDDTQLNIAISSLVDNAVIANNYAKGGLIGFSLGATSGSIDNNIVENAVSAAYQLETTWGGKFGLNNTEVGSPTYSVNCIAGAVLPNDFGYGWSHYLVHSGLIWENGKKIRYYTTYPSAGTWAVGDIVHNSTPTLGGVQYWICTTAGTPGTWTPVYDLHSTAVTAWSAGGTQSADDGLTFSYPNSGTAVSTLNGGYEGKTISIRAIGSATFSHLGGNINLADADSLVLSAGDVLTLQKSGSTWYEISRRITPAWTATFGSMLENATDNISALTISQRDIEGGFGMGYLRFANALLVPTDGYIRVKESDTVPIISAKSIPGGGDINVLTVRTDDTILIGESDISTSVPVDVVSRSDITLETAGTGKIYITSASDINLDGTNTTFTLSGQANISAESSINLTGGDVNVTTANGTITIENSNVSGDVIIGSDSHLLSLFGDCLHMKAGTTALPPFVSGDITMSAENSFNIDGYTITINATDVSDGDITLTGRLVKSGTALADADATINVSTNSFFTMARGTLTVARNITLGTTGAADMILLVIEKLDTSPYTLAILNGGTSGGTLMTIPVSTARHVSFIYDAISGDWTLGPWYNT